MREIKFEEVVGKVKKLCLSANFRIRPDVREALKKICTEETSPLCKLAVEQILENLEIAEKEEIPLCQDTGFPVVFVELGEEVKIVGGNLYQAIEKGLKQAHKEGYLRDSVVNDPLRRSNESPSPLSSPSPKESDTRPLRSHRTRGEELRWGSEIHLELVPGDKLKIQLIPKGAGSENNSALAMLLPGAGKEGVKKFVLETVEKGAYDSCAPIIVGVGIGGNFETCAFLAKKALLRPLGSRHKDANYAQLEEELLREINYLGIGPQGLGGRFTALGVFIETYPCHIASLPVAVNIQCNACRHEVTVI